MKKLSALFICVLLSATFLTAYAKEQDKRTPFMTRTFPASSIKEVEATTSGGSLALTGDAGSQATVEVYVSRDNWSNDQIKKYLDENYTLDIKVVSGKLYATAKQKTSFNNWNNQGLSISFKISVPKQVNSNLQTSGGSIQISALSGSQNFVTSGGSLAVDNVSGNTVGATSGGSISLSNSNDNIDLKTSGGSISAKDCNGTISLATSGGSLSLNNLSGNINAATSGGSVSANNINGTLITGTSGGSMNLDGISGNVKASTSGGNMSVKVKSVTDYVKLSNSGSINLTLPAGKGFNLDVKASKVESSMKESGAFRGEWKTDSFAGTINNGGPEINVRSSQRVWLSFE